MDEFLGRDAVIRTIQSLADALPPTMSVEDAAGLLGISCSKAYSEVERLRRTGGAAGIPSAAVGSSFVVLTAPLLDMLMLGDLSPELVASNSDSGSTQP